MDCFFVLFVFSIVCFYCLFVLYCRSTKPKPDGTSDNVLMMLVNSMGTTPMAATVTRVVEKFSPFVVANVGITGSIDKDLKIGDVMVPTSVMYYSANMKATDPPASSSAAGGVGGGGPMLALGTRSFSLNRSSLENITSWRITQGVRRTAPVGPPEGHGDGVELPTGVPMQRWWAESVSARADAAYMRQLSQRHLDAKAKGVVTEVLGAGAATANITAEAAMSHSDSRVVEKMEKLYKAMESWMPRAAPLMDMGDMASGDVLVASKQFQQQLKATNRKLMACEMEAGGFLTAETTLSDAHDSVFVCVRGISDPSSGEKADIEAMFERPPESFAAGYEGVPLTGREYCMRNAMRVLYAMVMEDAVPVKPHAAWDHFAAIRQHANKRTRNLNALVRRALSIDAEEAQHALLMAGGASINYRWDNYYTSAPKNIRLSLLQRVVREADNKGECAIVYDSQEEVGASEYATEVLSQLVGNKATMERQVGPGDRVLFLDEVMAMGFLQCVTKESKQITAAVSGDQGEAVQKADDAVLKAFAGVKQSLVGADDGTSEPVNALKVLRRSIGDSEHRYEGSSDR